MRTVKEVSRLTGVSVRALHHYDAIGLLHPAQITEAGYRLYSDEDLQRLHTILLLRQLQFPLKEIRQILDSPGFDPLEALPQQIELLELQRQQLDDLISHARTILKTGVIPMNFTPFDDKKLNQYAAEAKARWGKTEAYQEYEKKHAGKSQSQQNAAADGLMEIFVRFGQIRDTDPASDAAQALVAELKQYITNHYYTCTNQILRGLGMMYIAGDSMTENINNAGGEGTADFANRAIQIFCK